MCGLWTWFYHRNDSYDTQVITNTNCIVKHQNLLVIWVLCHQNSFFFRFSRFRKSHTSEPLHKCPFCAKTFTNMTKFLYHRRTHRVREPTAPVSQVIVDLMREISYAQHQYHIGYQLIYEITFIVECSRIGQC